MSLCRTSASFRAVRNGRLDLVPRRRWQTLTSSRSISDLSRTARTKATTPLSKSSEPAQNQRNWAAPASDPPKANLRSKVVTTPEQEKVKVILDQSYQCDEKTNATDTILNLVGRNLYRSKDHPLAITRALIESVFASPKFKNHIASNPVVTTKDNFDILGFPPDHPGRSSTDTYYVNSDTVLRTHTSAHQHAAFEKIAKGDSARGYTICADVYRRDSIDRSHFPVFHQMEGAYTWKLAPVQRKETRLQMQDRRTSAIKKDLDALPQHSLQILDEAGSDNDKTNPVQPQHDPDEARLMVAHLKRSLELLVQAVFTAAQQARGDQNAEQLKVRWIEATFPFTSPSFELEVFWNGDWLELLGSGVVKQSILNNAGFPDGVAWAWGIGIERLAMLLFNIPDIRLFWSQDPRFLSQFRAGQITHFEPFSKYPPCYKDISFWIRPSPAAASPLEEKSSIGVAAAAGGDATKASPDQTYPTAFHENDIMEIVRGVAGTLVEDVRLVDEFVHPKNGKKSLCYRINYRSDERTLTNEEVNDLHQKVIEGVRKLPVDIRD